MPVFARMWRGYAHRALERVERSWRLSGSG